MTTTPGSTQHAATAVARKIAVSIATGSVAYLLTVLSKQPTIWALTMSIFVAGVSLVVQFLIDFDNRLAAVDRQHRDQFGKISQATALFSRIEATDLRTDEVVTLVDLASRIDLGGRPLLAAVVRSEIRATTELFKQITHTMTADYPGEQRLFKVVDITQHTIKATSTMGPVGTGLVDEGYWDSPDAVAYLQHQREAIRLRKVSVKRIFIAYRREVTEDTSFQRVVRDHQAAGIAVRILPTPPTSHSGNIDFVLFDDEISYEFFIGPIFGSTMTSAVQSTQLVMRDDLVARRRAQFDEWWEQAIEPPLG